MLHAIYQGQTKANKNEDRFTSSIFQLLAYLPSDLLFEVFRKHLQDSELTIDSLKERSFEYWPKWDPEGIAENSKYVEPDLFIQLNNLDIIVETKRFDERGQYQRQWEKEYISYLNEYGNDRKAIIWAIGGIDSNQQIDLYLVNNKVIVYASTWRSLLSTLQEIQYEKGVSFESHVKQLFGDLFLSFELHGFLTGKWLNQKGFPAYQVNTNSITTIKRWNPII